MTYVQKMLGGGLLFILLLIACTKRTTPISPPETEPPTTVSEAKETDQELIEAQAALGLMLSTALIETAKSSIILATGAQPPCPAVSLEQLGSICGDDDLITIDFGTDCVLSGGATISGMLNIQSYAPCEMVENMQLPSLLATSLDEKMILTFTSVLFNGYTIEYLPGQDSNGNDNGIFFWNGGNNANPYFVFTFGQNDYFKVRHPNGLIYSIFKPFALIPALEIRPNDLTISLDVNQLDNAEYGIKLLAQVNNENKLVDYWQVQTFENGNTSPINDYYIITENNEDLHMTPKCNAIKGGILQLRSTLSSPANASVVREYQYGFDMNDEADLVECIFPPSIDPTNSCDDYVWVCDFDTNGACNSCRMVKCFFANE